MKKIIITLMAVAMPMFMHAQSEGLFARKKIQAVKEDMSLYTKPGAIPEVNGKVEWNEVITANGKSKADIFQNLAQWASFRYEPNSVQGYYTDSNFFKNLENARINSSDKNEGLIKVQGAEELIFSIKALAKNFTQVFYLLDLKVSDNKVEMRIHTIAFNVDQGAGEFVRVPAEDWITDKEALNKKGELRKISGKFRVKTIDLVDELKKEISEAINK